MVIGKEHICVAGITRQTMSALLFIGPGPSRARSNRADHTKAGPVIRLAVWPMQIWAGGAADRNMACLICGFMRWACLISISSAFGNARDIN